MKSHWIWLAAFAVVVWYLFSRTKTAPAVATTADPFGVGTLNLNGLAGLGSLSEATAYGAGNAGAATNSLMPTSQTTTPLG